MQKLEWKKLLTNTHTRSYKADAWTRVLEMSKCCVRVCIYFAALYTLYSVQTADMWAHERALCK